jgi:branched-chain amino acid transport system substrate-binding protein
MATGFVDVAFHEKTGGDGEYAMASSTYHHSSTLPESVKFVQAFQKRYGYLPDLHHQWGYTDMMVFKDVLERAASTDSGAILKALQETDMITPLGRVKFGPDGQNHEVKGMIVQWLNGKQEWIYPKEGASGKLVYPMPKWSERK